MSCGIHVNSYDASDKVNAEILSALKSGKVSKIKSLVHSLDAIQIADFLITSDFGIHRRLFNIIGNDFNPDVLTFLDADVLGNVVEILGIHAVASLVACIDQHDLLDVLRDLSPDVRLQVVELLPQEHRDLASEFLAYPKDSAGRLVNGDMLVVSADWDISMVINYLRKRDNVPDNLSQLFVIDERQKIVGRIYLSKLLLSPGSAAVVDIMDGDFVTINANLDQEEVAHIFKKYSLTSVPVVTDSGKIVGAISIEDVADVLRYEISDDIMKLGGIISGVNINARISHVVVNRLPWLAANIVFSLVISFMVGIFSDTISHVVAVAVLLPIVTSIGGCSASQSVSSSIRAIACREITRNNIGRIFMKESIAALSLGSVLGIVSGSIVFIRYHDIGLCAVYLGAVVGTFLVASMLGLLAPLLLHKTRFDPAIVSPVVVVAAADTFSYLFFLGVATLLLM